MGARESMEDRYEGYLEERVIGIGTKSENDGQGANEDISGVGQNGKTEETV